MAVERVPPAAELPNPTGRRSQGPIRRIRGSFSKEDESESDGREMALKVASSGCATGTREQKRDAGMRHRRRRRRRRRRGRRGEEEA